MEWIHVSNALQDTNVDHSEHLCLVVQEPILSQDNCNKT